MGYGITGHYGVTKGVWGLHPDPISPPQAAHWVLPHSPALARFYCSTQRTAARRLVLRM